ncbi:MAG TPA: DUF2279 domain-containing protein [Gemmatimonadaceae bacterium]|nr:DUF2279 domain-containing protein [Gemmatimonadaceae bacterium]
MLDIKLVVALSLLTAGVSGAVGAQSSSDSGATLVSVARVPIDSVIAKDSAVKIPRNPGCPLSPSQLTAVRTGVGTSFVAGNAYLYHYFKQAWWSGERAPHFFFHADWDQWFRDQDKFGHMLGGYHLARIGHAALKEACVSEKKAIIWSAVYAALFQLQIEIFDGQFTKYGFSYADMIANTTGQGLAVIQELHPSWNAIKPTFSYHKTLALRNNADPELRPSLDYSGQTYWFSADMKQLLPDDAKAYWPGFLRLSAGHSITDWKDPVTGASIRARRRLLLSIDFDPEKLPGDAPLWRTIKHTLSYYRFPAPALELTPKLHVSPWYR